MDKEWTDIVNLDWNVWNVWFHPKRALYVLDNLEIMNKETDRQLADTMEKLARSDAQLSESLSAADALRTRLAESERRFNASQTELDDSRRLVAELQEKLAEREDVESQLMAFDRKLTKIEDMKRGYEKRIQELESRLSDAHSRLKEIGSQELLEPGEKSPVIDMRQLHSEVRIINPYNDNAPKPKPKPAPAAGRYARKASVAGFAAKDNGGDADDWLLDFPENL